MPEIQTILCPVDFSNETDHALAHAVALARWSHGRIVGLHVFEPVFAPIPAFATAGHAGEQVPGAAALADFEGDITRALAQATLGGVPTEAHCVVGDPARTIVAWSESLPADLIVIGTHGAGGFEHLMLGSVTEKVLRKAVCPVMAIPPRTRTTSALPYRNVLCPVDFSDPSTKALGYAFAIARECGAAVTVVHVLESPDVEPRTNRGFSVPEYSAYRAAAAKQQLEQLLPHDAAAHCSVRYLTPHGKPYSEILATAADLSTDLIVMGVHGRNPLDVMLFGSTTNQVVRRATCPVLTLRG